MPTTRTASPTGSARERRRGVVVPWDFRASGRISREHLRVLELAFETFTRQWTTQMVTRLRTDISVELKGLRQTTYDEHMSAMATPSPLLIFSTEIGSAGILYIPAELVLSVVDHGLGGPGAAQPARELTELEVGVFRSVGDKVLASLQYAFATLAPLSPRREGTEQIPQLAQAAHASEQVLVADLTFTVGVTTGVASIMLVLPPLQQRLSADAPEVQRTPEEIEAEQAAFDAVTGVVPEVPIDVVLRLSPSQVTSSRVLSLAVGDVLRLPHPTNRPLEAVVADVVVARAVPTTSSTRLACMVVSTEEMPR